MDSTLIRFSAPFTFRHILLQNSFKSHWVSRHSIQSQRKFYNFKLQASRTGKETQNDFDEAAYEVERLRLDAVARESMAETSKREIQSGNDEDPKAWKWIIRKRIWDFMEAQNIAQNPRPVHHRIPNFVGAADAAKKVSFSPFLAHLASVFLLGLNFCSFESKSCNLHSFN